MILTFFWLVDYAGIGSVAGCVFVGKVIDLGFVMFDLLVHLSNDWPEVIFPGVSCDWEL